MELTKYKERGCRNNPPPHIYSFYVNYIIYNFSSTVKGGVVTK